MVQNTIRTVAFGPYTATYIRWGKALDLHGQNRVDLMGHTFHGEKNQQWEFLPCGAGFTINSAWTGSFLTARDLRGQGTLEIVMGPFPTCWELELMDSRDPASGPQDESGDVYVRIRLPHSEMALGIRGDRDGSPIFLTNTREDMLTYWRLSPLRCSEP